MAFPNESVWDYPRPPRVDPVSALIRVVLNDVELVHSTRTIRVLETSHPPTYYIPPDDIRLELLAPSERTSYCEWKGQAVYFDAVLRDVRVQDAAWSYPDPSPAFVSITDHIAFYPSKMTRCTVGEEIVCAQPGDFYGGWVTSNLVGPFKGAPGSSRW